jgi:methylglutaconyl-CoA hydratase
VTLEVTAGAGVLTAILNRPEARNALDDGTVAALDAAMDRAERDPTVRAFALRAAGRVFCAGVDLNRARTAGSLSEAEGIENTVRLTGMMLRLSRLSKPTLALVQGAAFGAGVGLVTACDIVVAVPEAQFALTQVRYGLVPGFVAPLLAHAVGARQARRVLLTGERFGAAEALSMGLVHEVVPADRLDARGAEIVAAFALGGPESLAGTKRVLDRHGPPPLDPAAVLALAEEVAAHRRTEEAQEGMAAFGEKRPPRWVTA